MQKSLLEIYKSLEESFTDVYVVPLIPFSQKKTSYLYTLYKDLIERGSVNIHSIGVFSHWRFVAARLRNKNTILHYHWLEFQDLKALLGMPYKLAMIALYKMLGGKLVWTMHNKIPHDRRFLNMHHKLAMWMAKKANRVLVHCEQEKKELTNFLDQPESKFETLPHPLFDVEIMPPDEAKKRIQQKYSIDIENSYPVFLVFGQISHYKGIAGIISAYRKTNSRSKLLIAGPVKKGNAYVLNDLESKARGDERIHLIPEYISEEYVACLHSIADYCVFNHNEVMTSGSIMMARSFKKNIIAPNNGCVASHSDDSIQLFGSQQELERSIAEVHE